jgi:hypothetical protein
VKLKLNPKFQPCPVDDRDEIYPNGFFHFNITKLFEFIQKNNFPVEHVSVQEIRSDLKADILDQDTIKTANLQNPIILAEISPNRFNVIDGNHRVEKAFRDSLSNIPAYRISPKDHVQFLTDEKSYKAYVRYWNDKLL